MFQECQPIVVVRWWFSAMENEEIEFVGYSAEQEKKARRVEDNEYWQG